jgi:hypothetical protein
LHSNERSCGWLVLHRLLKSGANSNSIPFVLRTPLMCAVEAACLLIAAKAKLTGNNEQGRTIDDGCGFLVESGVGVEAADDQGNSALLSAARNDGGRKWESNPPDPSHGSHRI